MNLAPYIPDPAVIHEKRKAFYAGISEKKVADAGLLHPEEWRRLRREALSRQIIAAQAREACGRQQRCAETERAWQEMKNLIKMPQRQYPSRELIMAVVAEEYGIRVIDIKSHRRFYSIGLPRQVAMYLCRSLTLSSLPQIGRSFAGRDHTTILHAVRKIEALRLCDPALDERLSRLECAIAARVSS